MPLDAALRIAWRIIFAALLFLILAEGLMFWRYGLGRAYTQAIGGEEAVIKVEEKLIQDAVEMIKNKRANFEAAKPVPADLPNPFR